MTADSAAIRLSHIWRQPAFQHLRLIGTSATPLIFGNIWGDESDRYAAKLTENFPGEQLRNTPARQARLSAGSRHTGCSTAVHGFLISHIPQQLFTICCQSSAGQEVSAFVLAGVTNRRLPISGEGGLRAASPGRAARHLHC